jgi:hypothetical protein
LDFQQCITLVLGHIAIWHRKTFLNDNLDISQLPKQSLISHRTGDLTPEGKGGHTFAK